MVSKRLGSPPHSLRFFREMWVRMTEKRAKLLMAIYDGMAIGAILLLRHKDKLYWRAGVMDDRFRHLNPTNLLLWRAMEIGAEEGLMELDLGRTRRGTGIYLFKSRWGGKEVYLRDYIWFSGRARELPEPYYSRYAYLSKPWSLVPISLSSKIGWVILKAIGF